MPSAVFNCLQFSIAFSFQLLSVFNCFLVAFSFQLLSVFNYLNLCTGYTHSAASMLKDDTELGEGTSDPIEQQNDIQHVAQHVAQHFVLPVRRDIHSLEERQRSIGERMHERMEERKKEWDKEVKTGSYFSHR